MADNSTMDTIPVSGDAGLPPPNTTIPTPLPTAQGPQGQLSPEEQQLVEYNTRRLKTAQQNPSQPVAFNPDVPYQSVTKAGAPVGFDPNAAYESVTVGGKPAPKAVPAPPEEKGLLGKVWNWATKGLISPDDITKAMTGYSTEEIHNALKADPGQPGPQVDLGPLGKYDLNTLATGTLQSSAGFMSGMTSPTSIALFGVGPLAGAAGKSAQALRAVQAAKAADAAVETADVVHAARLGEIARATQQANELQEAVRVAREAVATGAGTEEAAIAAETTASQAIKNVTNAETAAKEAQESLALNRVAAAQANRTSLKAVEAAKQAGLFGKIPEPVGKILTPVSKGALVTINAKMLPEALEGQRPDETRADMLERRLSALGWMAMSGEGLRGTKLDVPVTEAPGVIKNIPKNIGEAYEQWHAAREAKKASAVGAAADEIQNRAKKDFTDAVPSGPGKSNYTPDDLDVALPYLQHEHANVQGVKGIQDTYDALEHQRQGIEDKIKPWVEKYANDPLKIVGADNKPATVKQRLVEALSEDEGTTSGFTADGLKAIEKYNTDNPSLGEADRIRKSLNDANRGVLKKNMWDVATARASDPAFAARYELADILRDGVYDQLEAKGVRGAREMRQDEASLIRVRNAAERQLKNGERARKGTGEAGTVRQMLGTVAKRAIQGGIATGAASVAGPLGAGVVEAGLGGIGETVQRIIAPGDLTVDKLIQRSMKTLNVPGAPTELETGNARPAEVTPPLHPRENTPLHADLATHYGEEIGDTSYKDLEDRFLSDVKIKRQNRVPLEAPEKILLAKINVAKVEEIKAAQKAAEEAAKAAAVVPAAVSSRENSLNAEVRRISTGDSKTDDAITEGGGIPGGIQPGMPSKGLSDLAVFHDPQTRSTLMIPVNEVTAESVAHHLAASRDEFAKFAKETPPPKALAPGPSSKELGATAEENPLNANVRGVIASATKPIQETPKEILPYRYTDAAMHVHEYGHVAAAAIEGIDATDFASHLHDEVKAIRSVGGIGWQEDPYVFEAGYDAKYTPDQIRENVDKWLRVYMGGAASADLLHDIPFNIKAGSLRNDVAQARGMLEAFGLEGKEADALIRQAFNQTKENFLTTPGILDSIKENSGVRETGLGPELHASADRLEDFQGHIRRLFDAKQNNAADTENGGKGQAVEKRQPGISRKGTSGLARVGKEGAGIGEVKAPFKAEPHQQFPEDEADILAAYGLSPEQVAYHEAAHHTLMHENGFQSLGTIGQEHPAAKKVGGIARADWDQSQFFHEKTGYINTDAVRDRLGDLIAQLYAGPVADELHFGIKIENNKGASQDIKNVNRLMEIAKVPIDDKVAMHDAARARAKEVLTRPGVHDILQKYTSEREAGIPKEYLMTPDTVQKMLRELDEAKQNGKATETRGVNQRIAGEVSSRGRENVARTEGRGGESALQAATTQARAGRGVEAEGVGPLSQKLAETYGTTEDPHNAAFILSDGRMVPLHDTHNTMLEAIYNKYGDVGMQEAERTAFINNENAVRTRYRTTKGGNEVVFSVPESGVNEEQIQRMRQSVGKMRNGNAVIEVANESGKGPSTTKEFVRPSDIDPMLREIGVHPEENPLGQNLSYEAMKGMKEAREFEERAAWQNVAARTGVENGGFTIDPRTGKMPTEGKSADVYPEADRTLDHTATAADIEKFHDDHKAIFDEHPELQVGGYGRELNIAAIGPGAETVARRLKQISVYDLGKGEEIKIGGDGTQKHFPDYPLAQRLSDLKTGVENPIEKDLQAKNKKEESQ